MLCEVTFKNLVTRELKRGERQLTGSITYRELSLVAKELGISEEVIPIEREQWMPCNLKPGTLWPFNVNYQVFWRYL